MQVQPASTTTPLISPVTAAQPPSPSGGFSKALDSATQQRTAERRAADDMADQRRQAATRGSANGSAADTGETTPEEATAADTPPESTATAVLRQQPDCELPADHDPGAPLALAEAAATAALSTDITANLLAEDPESADALAASSVHPSLLSGKPQGTTIDTSSPLAAGQDKSAGAPSVGAVLTAPVAPSVGAVLTTQVAPSVSTAAAHPTGRQPDGTPQQRGAASLLAARRGHAADGSVADIQLVRSPAYSTPDPKPALDARTDTGPSTSGLLDAPAEAPAKAAAKLGSQLASPATDQGRTGLPSLATGDVRAGIETMASSPQATAPAGSLGPNAAGGAPLADLAPVAAGGPARPTEAHIPARLDSPGFGAAIGAQLSLMARDGVQSARLHLNPAEMGPVTVQISVTGHAARVDLVAEHAFTRQMLEQSMPSLAGALRESGLTLTGGGVFEQPRQPEQPDGKGAQSGRGHASGPDALLGESDLGPIAPLLQSRVSGQGVVDLYA